MKNFDTRAYSVNDFLEWNDNKQLELSPRFQRRSVWTDNARSYLMDTIVRGKPIPKVFIRQKLNPSTKASIREVVDGQQRLRTILSYLHDGFQINKRHNKEFGGLYFSQLNEVDEDAQANILNYEISVDLLVNMSDPEVLDVFGRLNSYAVVLNDQERINANHFGPFKTLADKLGHEFFDFWVNNRILSEAQIVRMGDVTLVADLLIAMIEGIRSKKQLKVFYAMYERDFPEDTDVLEFQFRQTLTDVASVFDGSLKRTEFRRNHIFYSLFTALYHLRWGLPDVDRPKLGYDDWNYARIRNAVGVVDEIFLIEDKRTLGKREAQFLEDSRRATTDAKVRLRRTEFLLDVILGS
jgi:hypothetical protein